MTVADSYQEVVSWAITPYKNGLTYEIKKTPELTVAQQRDLVRKTEKEWGNKIIGQKDNGNWTTLLGEGIVFETLKKLGENPRKPETKMDIHPIGKLTTIFMKLRPEIGLLLGLQERKSLVPCTNIVKSLNYMENHSKSFVLHIKNMSLLMEILRYLAKSVHLNKNSLS